MSKLLHARRVRLVAVAVAVAATTSTVTVVATDASASSTVTTTNPAKAAAGWLSRQLTGANHDHYAVTFNGQQFPDAGETIDGLLTMDAAGVAQSAAARMTSWLKTNAKDYATGSGATPNSYYPGALAKLLLAAEAQRANVHNFGGIDLVHSLRAEEQRDGGFLNPGDTKFSESPINQALALIALSHTGSLYDWPNARAIAWLVGQQCGDGGFTSSTQTQPAKTCTDVDATAYAAQALLTVHSSATARAMHWLSHHVNSDGGMGLTSNGTASSNANSTALALQAQREANHPVSGLFSWLRKHQFGCSAPSSRRGAVLFQGSSYNQVSALRATTQAGQALALRWLGAISNRGAISATTVLKC